MKTLKSSENEVQIYRSGDYYIAYCLGIRVLGQNANGRFDVVMSGAEMAAELSSQFDAVIARKFLTWSKGKR